MAKRRSKKRGHCKIVKIRGHKRKMCFTAKGRFMRSR